MTTATAQIANHLNLVESAIVRVEEWASVIFVVAKGIGARFVSKKVIKMEAIKMGMKPEVDKQKKSEWVIRFENKSPNKVYWIAINAKGVTKTSEGTGYVSTPTQEMIEIALTYVPKFINASSHDTPPVGYAKKLNVAWLNYNNLVNEGAEGYNPHPKYI